MSLRDKNGLTEEEFLAQYKPGSFPRPSVTADTVLFAMDYCEAETTRKLPEMCLEVLLIRRGGHPFLNKWALPGGFSEPGESLEETMLRELKEETGVENVYFEQLHTFSSPQRDPRGWTITCAFLAVADKHQLQLQAGDDASAAALFKVELICNDDKTYVLTLKKDDETLSATLIAQQTANPPKAIKSDLAFDHADIITCALLRMHHKVEYGGLAHHHSV